jgi:hypothetical protein
VPPQRIYHIQYGDLTSKPIDVVKAIYAHFGLRLSERGLRGMEEYVRLNPRTARPKHVYATGGAGETQRERALFRRYQDYFNVPDED